MSKFRKIVENALLEAKLYKFDFNGIEAFNNIDIPYLKVYRNPTRSEINSLCNNSKENQLRGLVIGNNIFVWDAYYSNHSDILDKIANEYPSLYDDSLIFYFMVYKFKAHVFISGRLLACTFAKSAIVKHKLNIRVRVAVLLENVELFQEALDVSPGFSFCFPLQGGYFGFA